MDNKRKLKCIFKNAYAKSIQEEIKELQEMFVGYYEVAEDERELEEYSKERDSMMKGFDAIKKFFGTDDIIATQLNEEVDNCVIKRTLENEPGTQLWEDLYWEDSPGSNQIHTFEIDGIKIARWTGANFDYATIYITTKDIT